MRRLLILSSAATLALAPATGLAQSPTNPSDTLSHSPLPGDDATTAAARSTTHALYAQGAGQLTYRGSGKEVVNLRRFGRIRVTAVNGAALTQTPTGNLRKRVNGNVTVWTGRGTLTLDGAGFTADAFAVRYDATVDAGTAGTAPVGVATGRGRGFSIIRGGIRIPFFRAHRVYLTQGALTANLAGSAFWHLGGPANGTLDLTINNRIRVWDYSSAKDLTVTGTDPKFTRKLADGSTLYYGLRAAHVVVTGTAFRTRIHSTGVTGTFTPGPPPQYGTATATRSLFRGFGTFSAGTAFQHINARTGNLTRVLIQPRRDPAGRAPCPGARPPSRPAYAVGLRATAYSLQ
ncbi:MAG: hypothetical protein U0Y82_02820 [Thermoleophilia bacterium]